MIGNCFNEKIYRPVPTDHASYQITKKNHVGTCNDPIDRPSQLQQHPLAYTGVTTACHVYIISMVTRKTERVISVTSLETVLNRKCSVCMFHKVWRGRFPEACRSSTSSYKIDVTAHLVSRHKNRKTALRCAKLMHRKSAI